MFKRVSLGLMLALIPAISSAGPIPSLFPAKEKRVYYHFTDDVYLFSNIKSNRQKPKPMPPKWRIHKSAVPSIYVGIGIAF